MFGNYYSQAIKEATGADAATCDQIEEAMRASTRTGTLDALSKRSFNTLARRCAREISAPAIVAAPVVVAPVSASTITTRFIIVESGSSFIVRDTKHNADVSTKKTHADAVEFVAWISKKVGA